MSLHVVNENKDGGSEGEGGEGKGLFCDEGWGVWFVEGADGVGGVHEGERGEVVWHDGG